MVFNDRQQRPPYNKRDMRSSSGAIMIATYKSETLTSATWFYDESNPQLVHISYPPPRKDPSSSAGSWFQEPTACSEKMAPTYATHGMLNTFATSICRSIGKCKAMYLSTQSIKFCFMLFITHQFPYSLSSRFQHARGLSLGHPASPHSDSD